MITTTLFPGRYVQGADALKRLGIEASRLGDHALIICDPYMYENMLPKFINEIEKALKISVQRFNRECSDEEIARLVDEARKIDDVKPVAEKVEPVADVQNAAVASKSSVIQATGTSSDALPCTNCGSLALIRNGTCHLCTNCGTTTGCS